MARNLRPSRHSAHRRRRGVAMVVAMFCTVLLLGITGALLLTSMGSHRERHSSVERQRAQFAAQTGVSEAMAQLTVDVVGDLGTFDQPVETAQGRFHVRVQELDPDTYVLTSNGRAGSEAVAVEATVRRVTGGIFNNAIFAGNSSGDPLYMLPLGGVGASADEIEGDLYSGGGIEVTGDAAASGTLRAKGTIVGAAGEELVVQYPPDLSGVDYATTAEVDVAQRFADGAVWTSDDAGGDAWQIAEEDPAHIFRRNPTDRAAETGATVKDDYFLEDPYETVTNDPAQDGSSAYQITLGAPGGDATGANEVVYYIDGNLWLHNYRTFSFKLKAEDGSPVRVTFAVRGNVYFSDNLFYDDLANDGVFFIALDDPDVEDSGNIYFGDPEFGTLLEMHGYMFAENNFYDVNLDATGSARVKILGNMTAGNKVEIDRDSGDNHTKLTIDFDERLRDGVITIPGAPDLSTHTSGQTRFRILTWRKVAHDRS